MYPNIVASVISNVATFGSGYFEDWLDATPS